MPNSASTADTSPNVCGSASRAGARLLLLFLVHACMPSTAALAHPEGFSGMHVTIDGDRIRASITVHTRDLDAWFPPGKYPDYVADVTREMEKTVDEIVELQIDGKPQPIQAVHAFLLEVGLIEIDVDYPLPGRADPAELLVWSKHLIRMPRGHQQLVFVEDRRQISPDVQQGVMRLDDVLSVERDAAAVILPSTVAGESGNTSQFTAPPDNPAGSEGGRSATVQRTIEEDECQVFRTDASRKPKARMATDRPTSRISFFLFGVEHILTGYDHLLFLAALLLACATFSEAATIVTCFTIAHSITLAMAALDVVRLSGAIVEPLIALSIVYIAIENLSGKPALWRRAAVTCFFGLIHGLGFASALRDIGLGTIPGGVVWPLLRFNLGVEAGQLCVAAVLLPLLLWAKRNERFSKALVPVGSFLVALIGAYWLVTRVASEFSTG
jgi:hydrogenase/urease accessory protein HupE